jgi:nitrogen fixation protein NifU and related proteins
MNEDLYQDQIIEWSKKSDNSTGLETADCSATASNPLCGDRISIDLQLEGQIIKAMGYKVRGCLLCKASSSILAELVTGMTSDELKAMHTDLGLGLKSTSDDPESFPEKFRLFFPVRLHKSRHSCVMLPFEAAVKAISGE